MFFYSNTSVETTLTNDIDAVATSIQIGDTTGLPVQYPYTLVLDYEGTAMEVVTVTSSAGVSLIVQRGQDGTSAQAHLGGARVVHAAVARDLQEPQNHIASDQNVHGVGMDSFVVGTETPQVLINKTMDGNLNTFTNIPSDALGPFEDVEIIQNATDTALTVIGNATVLSPAVLITKGSLQPGLVVQRIAGAVGTQPAIVVESDTGGDVFTVSGVGDVVGLTGNFSLSITTGTVSAASIGTTGQVNVGGGLAVTGNLQANSQANFVQGAAGTPAISVTAHSSPTAPAVRITGDESFAGLEVRRNSSTTTGDLMRFATEGGVTMAQYQRNGALVLPQVLTTANALSVTGLASATTPPAVFTGDPSQPAIRVRRNAATSLTADLEVWATDTNTVMSRVKRDGTMAAPDLLIGNDPNKSLAFALFFQDAQALSASTGWQLDRAVMWVWMERLVFINGQFTRTGAAISSPSTGPGITDSEMGVLIPGPADYAPTSNYVRGDCAPGAQFPAVMRVETDGRIILEAFSAPSLTIATGGGVPFNVMYVI